MINDKGSALYTQVKQKLLEDIRAGVYKVDEKIPTELELCTLYNVSRTTVRLALQQLELEGRIKKIQGKGTFVTESFGFKSKIMHRTLAPIISFPEQMEELGKRSESKVLESIVIPADAPLDELLQIEPRSPVTKLVRLRFADDEPVAHEISYIPWHVAPGLSNDDLTGSLFKLLRTQYGLEIVRSIETLEPVVADGKIADLLQIDSNTPSFQIKTVSYLQDGTPIEYSIGIYRSDTSNFIIERQYMPEKE